MGKAIVHHYLTRASEMKTADGDVSECGPSRFNPENYWAPLLSQIRWTRIRWQWSLLAPRAAGRRRTEEGLTTARLRTNAS